MLYFSLQDQLEAAAVYAEFLADFGGPAESAKSFVRGGVENTDKPGMSTCIF